MKTRAAASSSARSDSDMVAIFLLFLFFEKENRFVVRLCVFVVCVVCALLDYFDVNEKEIFVAVFLLGCRRLHVKSHTA